MAMQIELRMADGALNEIAMDPGSSVLQVKKRIAEEHHIPTECQKLVIGTEILDDATVLHGTGPVFITLVVVIEEVCAAMEQGTISPCSRGHGARGNFPLPARP